MEKDFITVVFCKFRKSFQDSFSTESQSGECFFWV